MAGAIKGGNLQGILAGFYTGALEHAFAAGTNASQKSALNAWRTFCSVCCVDWLLTGVSYELVVNIVLSYIGFEIGLRELRVSSIKGSYLS